MKGKKAEVFLNGMHVGTLAEAAGRKIAFAYTEDWIRNGFAISPFSLPLEERVFVPVKTTFHGLWGVFADSLPDAWGRLLVDRMLQEHGRRPEEVQELERLLVVGESGMGALTYQPVWGTWSDFPPDDLDAMCRECQAVLRHENIQDPDRLFRLGGSSGGARPKVMTDEWIIKFPASRESKETGKMEKEYMDCAESCGIAVPETKLMPSRECGGYFAVRRFDREPVNGKLTRKHMLTAAAILEADWRNAAVDYHELMKLTKILSRFNDSELIQMYRRMCFNVFAHNRDDHLKNFSWIYDQEKDCWNLSPAYDLTWSTTWFGEQTTTVDGNSKNPGMKEVITVGTSAGITNRKCKEIAEEIREKTAPLEERYRGISS